MNRYIVFLKQVPQSTHVEIDPVTQTLKRSSSLSQTNPDDLYALQAALDLKRATQAEVVAVSMGPASAETVLREALQRGADRAILVSSPAFAGSDTWCTSLTLAAVVRKIGAYSLLFFGRMAIDGDTAQVGPEVAGQLDIPQITNLITIEKQDEAGLHVRRMAGRMQQSLIVQLPCAIMVSRENGSLACPTLSGWRRAQQQAIIRWDEHDLGIEPSTVGLHASPTQVASTAVPQQTKNIRWINKGSDFSSLLSTFLQHSTSTHTRL